MKQKSSKNVSVCLPFDLIKVLAQAAKKGKTSQSAIVIAALRKELEALK